MECQIKSTNNYKDVADYYYQFITEDGMVEFKQCDNLDLVWHILPKKETDNFSFTIDYENNQRLYLAIQKMFEELEKEKINHLNKYITKETVWRNNEEVTYRLSKNEKRRRKQLFKNVDPYYKLIHKNTFIWQSDAPANENSIGIFVYNYWIINKINDSYIFTFTKSKEDYYSYQVEINTDRSRYDNYRLIVWDFFKNLKTYLTEDYQITLDDYMKSLNKSKKL